MINKKWLFIAVLFPQIVIANNMHSSFEEGRNATQNLNPIDTMKNFNPGSEFEDFQNNPKESQYYTGIKGNEPNIGSKGMEELRNSEIGETLIQSITNNPKDNISWDSDIAKNAENIKDNAAYIASGDKNQCFDQVLMKSRFTNHFCEKDRSIEQSCISKASIDWQGERKTIEETFEVKDIIYTDKYISGNRRYQHFKFKVPKTGIFVTNNTIGFRYYKDNEQNKDGSIFFEVKEGEFVNGFVTRECRRGGLINSCGGNWSITLNQVNFVIKSEVNTIKPILKWNSICPIKKDSATVIRGQCIKKGGIETLEREGEKYQINVDCWEYEEKHIISEASDNECIKYENEPNCSVGELECLVKNGENCLRHRVKYQCQHTTKTMGKVCGDKFFCNDGSCSELEDNKNKEFGHAVSQLATLAQAGKDIGLSENNLKAFSGKAMYCRKSGFGFSDCCKDSGWGHKVGLAHCNNEETALGRAKEKKLVIYTGTYCDKKVLKKCIRKKSSYCVFDNKLARIIQYQGRSGQLGIGFGSAQSPNCRGLQVEELEKINFQDIDYSDFFDDLNNNKNIPSQGDMIDYIKKSISGYYQE